jgi:hypothetical protein
VVCDNAPEVYEVPIFVISVQVVNGEIELCHLRTEPIFPVKDSNPLVLPEHNVLLPFTVPPIVVGDIVTVVETEFAIGQLPR